MAPLTFVAGSSGLLYVQLLDAGTPIDLTDFTVTLRLTGTNGVDVSTTINLISATQGLISLSIPSSLLDTLSPYKARWILTEDTGVVYYIPSASRDEWDVVPL